MQDGWLEPLKPTQGKDRRTKKPKEGCSWGQQEDGLGAGWFELDTLPLGKMYPIHMGEESNSHPLWEAVDSCLAKESL